MDGRAYGGAWRVAYFSRLWLSGRSWWNHIHIRSHGQSNQTKTEKAKRPTVLVPDAPRPSRRLDDSAWRTPLKIAATPPRQNANGNGKTANSRSSMAMACRGCGSPGVSSMIYEFARPRNISRFCSAPPSARFRALLVCKGATWSNFSL